MLRKNDHFSQKIYMISNNKLKIPPAGLEPATFGSTVQRSAKLS